MRPFLQFLFVFALGFACCFVSARCAAPAAPAPTARREARGPAVRPGEYRMRWGSTAWRVTLSPCGAYRAECGTLYQGYWLYDARAGVLLIGERAAGSAGRFTVYEVRLDARLCGRAGRTEVRLERVR